MTKLDLEAIKAVQYKVSHLPVEEIDALRLKAFVSNTEDDVLAYYKAASSYFQDYHTRAMNREAALIAQEAALVAADRLFNATEFMTDNDPEDVVADGGITAIMVGLNEIRAALTDYRTARKDMS